LLVVASATDVDIKETALAFLLATQNVDVEEAALSLLFTAQHVDIKETALAALVVSTEDSDLDEAATVVVSWWAWGWRSWAWRNHVTVVPKTVTALAPTWWFWVWRNWAIALCQMALVTFDHSLLSWKTSALEVIRFWLWRNNERSSASACASNRMAPLLNFM